MRYVRLLIETLFCLLFLSVLSGCGKETVIEETNPYAYLVSMEETPIVDYSVPHLQPNLLVDNRGYYSEDEKIAIVNGNRLPEQFRLVNDKTGEIVLTGNLEEITYHTEQELYSGMADFSAIREEGTYYLECDMLGRSYSFSIEKNLYGTLFTELYEQYMESCQKRSLTLTDAITWLEAYEWYTNIFPDEDLDRVPDILKELRGWVSFREENGVDEQEEALYAAFLAKFSYLYQKYDHEYATDCLKRGSTVYEQIKTTIARDSDCFFALTELYRATGLYTYRNQILEYKSFFENNSSYLEEPEYLYAGMTYMATRQKVDVDLCELFMENLLERGEEICNRYQGMVYPPEARNNGSEDLLNRAMEVSCANYVMNNYQYTKVSEAFLHYLLGCNMDSVNFYQNEEEKTGYIILLAQLAANHPDSTETANKME